MNLICCDEKIPTLCLNMIVKNESKIITRLLESVLPIIDCYCVCDTGSTDDTVDMIKNFFEKKNIPGKVFVEPFKNFSHNRNVALNNCLGMSDFVLLLDADMCLQINKFDKKQLNEYDSFCILQGNDSFYYYNSRIVRNNGLYDYAGVTHEYINLPPNNRNKNISRDELFILDIGDGGSKTDKFERDIRLLLDGIKEEPKNQRYYFYLANSYHDIGRYGEAINIYKKRIEFGGWKEEVWYSYYRIGLCYKYMNRINDAICYWMEGFDFYPERLEGLYEIIRHYRVLSKYKLAFVFYNIAKNVLSNSENNIDNYLFLHKDIYSSKIYYEYTIIASWVGIQNINDEAIKVFNYSKDNNEIQNLYQNMKFYKDILHQEKRVEFDNNFKYNIHDREETNYVFYSSSSCLIPNKKSDGYGMNIRYVNYYITNNGSYVDFGKHITTINKYVELDKNLCISSNERMIEFNFENRMYVGVEDVRIYNDKDSDDLLFIGSGYRKNNEIGIISGYYDIQNYKLKEENEIVTNFSNSDCEKNWVFVEYNGSLHVVYQWYPLKICKIENNVLKIVCEKKTPQYFLNMRGSSCGFKYTSNINDIKTEEIWFVTHIASYEEPRHYYHAIVVFDSDMNLLRYSSPFKFEGESIEYCLSIVVEDERVLINYSTWDRTTKIGVYNKKYIDSIVKYV
jgi:tetratricopeptide (TPR) repeat protein